MSEHVNFLAKYGTDKHRENMLKYPDGRSGIMSTIGRKYSPSPTDNTHYMDEIADRIHKEYSGDSDKMIHPDDATAARDLVKHGNDNHRDKITKSSLGDRNLYVGVALAEYGNDSHRESLVDHPHEDVRRAIAFHGNDSQKHKLINDRSDNVRANIARTGNDSHRAKLVDDYHPMVRNNVAVYGNDEHRNKVYEYARQYPAHYGRTLDAVAKKGTSSQRDEILNHSRAATSPFLDALHSIKAHPEATEEQKNKASELFKQMDDR